MPSLQLESRAAEGGEQRVVFDHPDHPAKMDIHALILGEERHLPAHGLFDGFRGFLNSDDRENQWLASQP